ncbi:hypothetical protein BAPKO_3527 (plasmid) [Borreliella afzelii PKo]|nr:hypothetical protein BAPKO_3527 [Borreliella afzelii PKo]
MLVVRGLFGNYKLYILRIICNFYLENNPLMIDIIIFAVLDIAIGAIIIVIIIINLLLILSFSNKNFS